VVVVVLCLVAPRSLEQAVRAQKAQVERCAEMDAEEAETVAHARQYAEEPLTAEEP
jgi:hypothetical protein